MITDRFGLSRRDGFTLLELMIVLVVIGILISIAIPKLAGVRQDAEITEAQAGVRTVQIAVESYIKNNGALPANIVAALTGASPQLISSAVTDPFNTSSGTYGYVSGTDATAGNYYIIYSQGPNALAAPTWDSANDEFDGPAALETMGLIAHNQIYNGS